MSYSVTDVTLCIYACYDEDYHVGFNYVRKAGDIRVGYML
jgi:hypothetical protein